MEYRRKVIKGQKRGRKIGFPTCNLQLNDYIVPRNGVYAVQVKGSNFNKKGIANIGFRPTFNGKKLLLETNIFGIDKNLYNKEIDISFKKFIRQEKNLKILNI
jgi:riboflavin kinase/FMN adenylyltransferase